jgi:hypothetical protein
MEADDPLTSWPQLSAWHAPRRNRAPRFRTLAIIIGAISRPSLS